MGENLLIFGASSYIGKVFSEYAKTKLAADSRIYSLSSSDCNLLDAVHVKQFFDALPKQSYQAVIFSVINKSVANSYDSLLANMAMIRNFIDSSQSIKLESVIYLSSADVYGVPKVLPITENSQIAPDTSYGLAKYNCEWMLVESKEITCPVTVVRIPGIFGQAKNDRSIIGKIVSTANSGETFKLVNGGNVLRDYVWVADLARLLLELTRVKYKGVINAVTGVSYSLKDIVENVSLTLNKKIVTVNIPGQNDREFDLCFDTTRLRELVPNFFFSELRTGIESYFDK